MADRESALSRLKFQSNWHPFHVGKFKPHFNSMTCCVCQDNRFSGLASYHFGLVLRLSRLSNYWDYPDYTDRTSTIRLIRVIPRISYYLVSSPFNRLIKLYATSRFAHCENRLLFDVSVYPCQSFRKIDKNSI